MKNVTTLLFVSALFIAQSLWSQDSIPNGSFEVWYSPTLPKSWQTTNMFTPPGISTCTKSTDNIEGQFAMNMKTVDIGGGQLVPAVATLGELGIGYTAGGIEFTSRPVALKMFIKHPSNGDMVQVAVEFFKEGFSIGGAQWLTTDSLGDFTEIVLPINYINNEYPDTMNITMLTDLFTLGSGMTVDGLAFEYATTSVNEMPDAHFHIYPNPCVDYIKFTGLKGQIQTITVLDLSGRLVLLDSSPLNEINVSFLRQGMYSLIIKTDEHVFSKKFLKVR